MSTLGKLLVEGPDAVALLERLYPNRFGDMKPGRIRYGVLTSDGGRIMDDGTIARLADDLFYVTTTSTGADAVTAWFEWWNAVWGYDAEIVNVTGALAAVNLAGPQSRDALGRLVDDADDVAADEFKYLDAKHLEVAGVPTLALRIGFVGELGYELHFPSPAGEHLWDALVAEGARPFGLEPQRVLRLEKGHIIVGQDTDSESNLYSAGMPWLPKMDKDDFVGKFALEHFAQRDEKEKLVGFTMEENVLPAEGAQIVDRGPSGRARHERPAERGRGRGHRAGVGADRALAARDARRDRGRAAAARREDHARRVLRPVRGADALVSLALSLSVALRRGGGHVAASARARGRRSGGRARPLAGGHRRDPRRRRCRRPRRRRGARAALAAARVPLHGGDRSRRRPRAGGRRARLRRDGRLRGDRDRDEQVLRRLTDLDLERIPTAGPFAHVTALFRRDADGWFRVYVHAGARPLRRRGGARRDRGAGGLEMALSEIFFPKRMWRPRPELKRRATRS